MKTVVILLLTSVLLASTVLAVPKIYPTIPLSNQGKPWRIAYLEGGSDHENVYTLKAVVKALVKLGWMDAVNFPKKGYSDDASRTWEYLADQVQSPYIQFVKDAFWSPEYDPVRRKRLKQSIIHRLNNKKDIDLVIAMGTQAGQDLANDQHSTPTLVFASNDPLAAGIVKSTEYSGYEHIHAQVEPTRYKRQIELFHNIFQFKRLGIAFGKGVAASSYAALEHVQAAAQEKGFEIITCQTKDDYPDLMEAYQSVVRCYRELSKKVDAIYITAQRGITPENLRGVLAPIIQQKIPSFSQNNFDFVKQGVLISITQASLKNVGRFHAENIARTLNGAKPGSLNQIFDIPIRIAINFNTLEKIGRIDLFDQIYNILPYTEESYY